jgi:P27 family predicted phage terminase small subunit
VRTEVAALDELPPPPAHLTPEQRELWHGLVTTYAAAGVLSQLDHVNIVRVCQLHAERAMWLRIVTESPTVSVPVKSRQGDVIGEKVTVHPAVAALRACDRALDTITTQLCLSPAARARTGWLVAEIANTEAHTDSILERLARPQRDVIDVTGIAED